MTKRLPRITVCVNLPPSSIRRRPVSWPSARPKRGPWCATARSPSPPCLGGAHSGRWGRHSGLLYGDGRRHRGGRRQGAEAIRGRSYLLETGLKADLSLVKAWKGDRTGNLVYRKTARNFNPMIATCGTRCVAEVERLCATGTLDPDGIHTPGGYVHRLVEARSERRIEQRTTRASKSSPRSVAITTSPSNTQLFGIRFSSVSCSSGKYRSSCRASRLWM